MIRVLFFGKLSDLSPPLEFALPEGVTCVDALISHLGEVDSFLAHSIGAEENLVIINETIVPHTALLSDGDEIAFASPLSGG